MLNASVLLFLAASASAAWVKPEPRFAAPSGGLCGFSCPSISGFSVEETEISPTTTTRCTYRGPAYSVTGGVARCQYNTNGVKVNAESGGECAATYTGTCQASFPGTIYSYSGTYTYSSTLLSSSGTTCYYQFNSDVQAVKGACLYNNVGGALAGGGVSGATCPSVATCRDASQRRRRAETKLEKVIRSRQYKYVRPAAPN